MTHGWILVQVKVGLPAAFLKMITDQERLYLDIIYLARFRKYVWVWLVNDDDWAIEWAIIQRALVSRGLLAEGAGPKPRVPTMPPFSC